MNEALIKEVFSDEAFVKSLSELETAEEVQAALKEKNLDFSLEDIAEMQTALTKRLNDELPEDELENVAGGFAISATIIAVGIAAGSVGAALFSTGSFVNEVTRRRW